MRENIVSLKRTARLAGLLYLVLGLLGFYAIMYVPNRIFVRGDTATSAKNLLTDEFLFRTSIVSHLLSVVTFLFLAFVLYKLFRKVNEQQAKLLVALVVVQVPIIFLLETFDISSLMTLKGQVFKAATHAQLQDVSQLFLKIHGYGLMTVEIFWGLWLIPFGLLVYKSVFIPRVLGVLLISAGLGYTIDSLTFLLFPGFPADVGVFRLPRSTHPSELGLGHFVRFTLGLLQLFWMGVAGPAGAGHCYPESARSGWPLEAARRGRVAQCSLPSQRSVPIELGAATPGADAKRRRTGNILEARPAGRYDRRSFRMAAASHLRASTE